MNTEEIDSHVETHLDAIATNTKAIDLCNLYHGVRPILKFAAALLFWKPKWQTVLNDFISHLDEACPV
jgi:hypothetical protein